MNWTDIVTSEEIHKKAEEWYNRGVVPCRREMQQDICAWEKDVDSQFKEVITIGFFYGYYHALEDMKKYDNHGADGEKSVADGLINSLPEVHSEAAKGETKI